MVTWMVVLALSSYPHIHRLDWPGAVQEPFGSSVPNPLVGVPFGCYLGYCPIRERLSTPFSRHVSPMAL